MPAFDFTIRDTSSIISPGLVVFPEVVKSNLAEMIRTAGGVTRLRPHCKTHKMAEVTEIQMQLGITRHKCARHGRRYRHPVSLQPRRPQHPTSRTVSIILSRRNIHRNCRSFFTRPTVICSNDGGTVHDRRLT